MTTDQPIDVAIIGGGPAGYAAAIYAARANLTTTVIEQGMSGGQIATTNEVENYPGIPLLSGAELGERFQQHAEGLGAQVEWSMVTGVDYDAGSKLFTVHHDVGDTTARSVIACMGATPRPAGFAGEDTYRGRGLCNRWWQFGMRRGTVPVRHCQQCDHRAAPRPVPCA